VPEGGYTDAQLAAYRALSIAAERVGLLWRGDVMDQRLGTGV